LFNKRENIITYLYTLLTILLFLDITIIINIWIIIGVSVIANFFVISDFLKFNKIKKADYSFESSNYGRTLIEAYKDNFDNIGFDEDLIPIGNCKHCGARGVMIEKHECN